MLKIRNLRALMVHVNDLDLEPGVCVAVMGPSGSGKSLFLRAIADLDPSEGEISLHGKDRLAMTGPEWRRRVIYVGPESGWWEETVHAHFQDPDAMTGLLLRLGLSEECMGWPISRLSTGERQRLAIARAMDRGPKVLLMDEPTGALDQEATARVESTLHDFLQDGGIGVIATHEKSQATRIASRTLKIEKGRLSA